MPSAAATDSADLLSLHATAPTETNTQPALPLNPTRRHVELLWTAVMNRVRILGYLHAASPRHHSWHAKPSLAPVASVAAPFSSMTRPVTQAPHCNMSVAEFGADTKDTAFVLGEQRGVRDGGLLYHPLKQSLTLPHMPQDAEVMLYLRWSAAHAPALPPPGPRRGLRLLREMSAALPLCRRAHESVRVNNHTNEGAWARRFVVGCGAPHLGEGGGSEGNVRADDYHVWDEKEMVSSTIHVMKRVSVLLMLCLPPVETEMHTTTTTTTENTTAVSGRATGWESGRAMRRARLSAPPRWGDVLYAAVESVCEADGGDVTEEDVEDVMREMLREEPEAALYEAAALMEMVMHVVTASGRMWLSSADAERRCGVLKGMFERWCAVGVVNRERVLRLMGALDTLPDACGLFSVYFDALAECGITWGRVMSLLAS